jgi:hypothetical protein
MNRHLPRRLVGRISARRGHKPNYSITLSASASSRSGTSIPSAFAVLTLMTSSNFVGCSIGKSAGWAVEAGDKAGPDRVFCDEEHDGEFAVAAFAGSAAGVFTAITFTCCPNQIRCETLAVDRIDSQPNDTRLRRSLLRQSRYPSSPGGMHADGPRTHQATRC